MCYLQVNITTCVLGVYNGACYKRKKMKNQRKVSIIVFVVYNSG